MATSRRNLDPGVTAPVPGRRVLLRPGWPLVVLLGAFPLWWASGLGVLSFLLVAVPMAVWLLRLRVVRTPPGFGLWLLFLLWAIAGVVVLGLDAPGTQPTTPDEQVVGYVFRLAWYAAATVALLYVGNQPIGAVTSTTVHRLLGWLFLVTVAGGYLGFFLPQLDFDSPVERLLPSGVPGGDFLAKLTHPSVAQQMDIGVDVTRPSAPFVYANDWGAMYGLLLPSFLFSWLGPDAGRRRAWCGPLLLLAAPPFVFSLNRGLWLGLLVVCVLLAVRSALLGRPAAVALLAVGLLVGGAALAVTPLGDLVQTRLDNPHSNEGRSQLAVRSLGATWEASPVLGYGSTREVQGNFFSIAGGDSAACVGCSTPQLGTQGLLWLLVFAHGFTGAAFFLGFLARRALAVVQDPAPLATASLAATLYFLVVTPFYDLSMLPLVVLMVVLAVAWRAEGAAPSADGALSSPRGPSAGRSLRRAARVRS